jgi:anti-sigma factor RsiW
MTCYDAEALLLEALDDALAAPVRRALDGHLATCARCAAFSADMRAVDAALMAALPQPVVPPSIAPNVRTRVRRERRAALRDSLPDLVHLAGCTIATALAAALLPIDASATVAAGVAFTCVSYMCLAVVRWSLESIEQPDW